MVIDENGTKLGVFSREEALNLALEKGLDLIEVSPQAKPPVAKIIDFGKLQYRQEKAARKMKAKQKKIEIKGIRLTLKIGKHDLEIKTKQALKFLDQGHKIKVEMILRGRERAHLDLAREIIQNFEQGLGERIIKEQPLTKQGGRLTSILTQKK